MGRRGNGSGKRWAAVAVSIAALVGASGCGVYPTGSPETTVPGQPGGPGEVMEGRRWRRGRRRRGTVAAARWSGRPWRVEPAALALAQAWARSGEFEHASIRAFEDLAHHLRTHGAPGELVRRCHEAADDERDHTRRCFALASRHAGLQVRPGRLPVRLGTGPAPSLTRLAEESILDGILNEGAAALLAEHQLAEATDADTRATLAVIAEDEARHAELGWAVLAWALSVGGARGDEQVERAVAWVASSVPAPRVPAGAAGVDPAVAATFGRGAPAALPAALSTLHDEVVDRLGTLLGRTASAARPASVRR